MSYATAPSYAYGQPAGYPPQQPQQPAGYPPQQQYAGYPPPNPGYPMQQPPPPQPQQPAHISPQPQAQQPTGQRPVDLDDLFDFGRPAGAAPNTQQGPPRGPPPPPVTQDPFFGGPTYAQPAVQQQQPGYPGYAPPPQPPQQPTVYQGTAPAATYQPQTIVPSASQGAYAPAGGYYPTPQAQQQQQPQPTVAPGYDPSAVYSVAPAAPLQGQVVYAPQQPAGPAAPGYPQQAQPPFIGAPQPMVPQAVDPSGFPAFTHPGLQRPGPATTAVQQPGFTTSDEEDRIQLERIRRLRQELEREQRREEQAVQEKDTWPCTQCTLRNPMSVTVCSACDHPRPGYSQKPASAPTSGQSAPSAPRPAPQPERWTCSKCATQNSTAANICKICDSPMPGTPGAPTTAVPTTVATPSTWACGQCTFANALASARCQMCDAARPAGIAPTAVAPPRPVAPQQSNIWNCGTCTLENPLTAARCSACGAAPPPGTRILAPPVQQQQPMMAPQPARQVTVVDPRMQPVGYQQYPAGMRGVGPAVVAQQPPRPAVPADVDDDDEDNIAWQRDADAVRCNKCDAAFGVLNRRHHCRVCGFVFCNSCTSNRLKLKPNGKDERLCTDCYRTKTAPPAPVPSALRATTQVMPPGVSEATRRAVMPVAQNVPCDCALAAEGFHRNGCPNKR